MGHRSIFVRIIVGPEVAKDGKVVPITEILRGMFIAESLSTSVTTRYYTNLLYQHFYDYHRRNASNNISCKHENALNFIVKIFVVILFLRMVHFLNITIEHGFQCINVCQSPKEMLKTEAVGRGFQHIPRDLANGLGLQNLPRDLANVNALENNV